MRYIINATVDFSADRTETISVELERSEALPFEPQFCEEVDGRITVSVPRDQFAWENRMPDQLAYEIYGGQPQQVNRLIDSNHQPQAGCIVVLLESPHSDEYVYAPRFAPLGPLQNEATRTRLESGIPRMLAAIGPVTDGTEVVLCNPVPYQASLHRMMMSDPKARLQRRLRNVVWRALFAGSCAEDFAAKLRRYRPAVVINVCTSALRSKVGRAIASFQHGLSGSQSSFRAYDCNHHPSFWQRGTRLEPVGPPR